MQSVCGRLLCVGVPAVVMTTAHAAFLKYSSLLSITSSAVVIN